MFKSIIKQILLLLFVSAFFIACSVKNNALKDEMSEAEKNYQQAIQTMLQESSYNYGTEKVLRFKEGRFAIYKDRMYAPTHYGYVEFKGHELRFVSQVRSVKHVIEINATAIRLFTKNQENILQKQDYTDFYEPENFFEAIDFGYLVDVNRLYNEGLLLNDPDELGNLPLIKAIYSGRIDMARFFIEKGVDIRLENANAYTALHVAIEMKNSEMVDLLLKHGAKEQLLSCESFLGVIQKDETFSMAKQLIREDFDVSCNNSELLFWVIGSEALAEGNHTDEALDFLLDHHVKTDVFSYDQGDTAIMRAAAIGNDRVLKKLIDYGSNTKVKDRFGRTALDFDSLYLEKPNPEISKILRASGLTEGIKADSDVLYKKAFKLLGKGNGSQAYEAFLELSKKYKQKRFYKGLIRALDEHKKPSMKMIKELIEMYAYIHQESSEDFYLDMIRFYEKMLPLCHSKEDLDENGNYAEDSVWYVYEKIDRLYASLFETKENIDYLYRRWKNYKRFKELKVLKRMDLKSAFGTRYVGETLDGKPFGRGALQYRDGSKYYGDVFYYIRHGKGKMTYANGQIHDGLWQNDSKEGKAFFTDENNALYLGYFKNNELMGEKKLLRKGRSVPAR